MESIRQTIGRPELLFNTAINHPNEKLTKAAVYALADDLEPQELNQMLEILKKAKFPEVRKAALHSILDVSDDASSVKALTEILKTEKDLDMRISAVYVLGDSGSDAAVPVLLETAKGDSSVKVRTAAVNALGNIGSPKAKEALKQILESTNE